MMNRSYLLEIPSICVYTRKGKPMGKMPLIVSCYNEEKVPPHFTEIRSIYICREKNMQEIEK